MRRTQYIIILLTVVLLTPVFMVQAQDTIKVAVMDFKAEGSEGSAVSDVVRNELINTGAFTIAERESLEKVVAEQQLRDRAGQCQQQPSERDDHCERSMQRRHDPLSQHVEL